jgi:hypothetical protein
MRSKYLVSPFICCLAAWTYANGTVPLLPLYAMEREESNHLEIFHACDPVTLIAPT